MWTYKYISSEEHKSPLDFFSWHSYDVYWKNCSSSLYVRKWLDEYGFAKTESILNEWNPGTRRRGTEADACYIAQMICALHRTPLDMLMYYDGQVDGAYEGLFNPLKNDVFPAYYAFHSFNELYVLGSEAYTETDDDIPVLAAVNGTEGKIIVPNASEYLQIRLSFLNFVKNSLCFCEAL